MSAGRYKEKFTVSTPFSVARAKWRPGHRHHITRYSDSNCPVLKDFLAGVRTCTAVLFYPKLHIYHLY